MSSQSDHRQWLRACRRGDETAAKSLYALVAPSLLAFARSIVRDGQLAEDVVQGVMCGLFRTPKRVVDRVEDPCAWLAARVRREALTALRSRRRSDVRDRGSTPRNASGAPPDARIGDAVDALPIALREVVVLKHVAGMTFAQIGVSLGVSPNTAASRHRAALERLRRSFESDESTRAVTAAQGGAP